MQKHEVEAWLRAGRTTVINNIAGLQQNWWPNTSTGNHQALASAWGVATFIHAARERCSGPILTASFSADAEASAHNVAVRDAAWSAPPTRVHDRAQVLVDFSVHNWAASNPIQFTGESETNVQHGVGMTMDPPDDYSWDFYKLLVIPSTTRLFFARVGGDGGVSAQERCATLASSLVLLVDLYGPAFLRPHDEIGAVVIPAARTQQARTRILWSDRGRLRNEEITTPIL